jgi:hypothetical protein
MPKAASDTRFVHCTGFQALLSIALAATAILWCLSASFTPSSPISEFQQDGSDLRLYRSILERVHSGENYYDVAGQELRKQGYPSGSLFNWRMPVYAWLIGKLPSIVWGQVVATLCAGIAILLAYGVVENECGRWQAAIVTLLLTGAFLWCLDGDAYLAQELWSGIFVLISVLAYARGWWVGGVVLGVLALLFRELALPYCAIAIGLAVWKGRRKEIALWGLGLAIYGFCLGYHALQVGSRVTSADRVPASWIQFGGAAFVLATTQMNYYLFNSPRWVCSIYLGLSLLGLASWKTETGLRLFLTASAYVAAFAIVGQPFNNYWGLMYAPLLPFGIVWAPAAMRDLARSLAASSIIPLGRTASTPQ